MPADFDIRDKFTFKFSKKGYLEPVAENVCIPKNTRSAPPEGGQEVLGEVSRARLRDAVGGCAEAGQGTDRLPCFILSEQKLRLRLARPRHTRGS